MDLDTLVTAACLGDPGAFGEIWRLLAGRVAGYLRGRGVQAVDDVTSEVFLAAFAGLAGFRGDGAAFRSWLFTLAHHKAVDAVRRHRPADPYDPETDRRATASAEDDALAGLEHSVLLEALAGLTDEQREVLLLRVLGDLPVRDVAALTGSTEGAVRQTQKRAVAALRARTVELLAATPTGGRVPAPVPGSSGVAIAELP
jgi:RNA polymerase sigma-70 factor (ECF subfamily)